MYKSCVSANSLITLVRTTPTIVPPLSVSQLEDMPVQLTCEGSPSWPVPQFSWFRDSTRLSNTAQVNIVTAQSPSQIYPRLIDTTSRLRLLNPLESDTGNYTCRASQIVQGLNQPYISSFANESISVEITGW